MAAPEALRVDEPAAEAPPEVDEDVNAPPAEWLSEPAPSEDPATAWESAAPQFEDAGAIDAEAAIAEVAVPDDVAAGDTANIAVGATVTEAEAVEPPAEPGPDADLVSPEAALAAADPDPAPTVSAAERSETLSLVARSEREGNDTMADQAEPTSPAPGSQDDDAPAAAPAPAAAATDDGVLDDLEDWLNSLQDKSSQ